MGYVCSNYIGFIIVLEFSGVSFANEIFSSTGVDFWESRRTQGTVPEQNKSIVTMFDSRSFGLVNYFLF